MTSTRKLLLFFILFFIACGVKQAPMPSSVLSSETVGDMQYYKGYWIEVQIPQRRLLLAKGSHHIKTFPIAVGQPEFPTPVGKRMINQVIWNPWWVPPKSDWVEDPTPIPPRHKDNPLGEIKMPIGNAYLIHGTKAVASIGQWASHGCIRMLFKDLFGLVQLLLTEYSHVSAIDEMEKANADTNKEFATPLNQNIPVVLTYNTVKVKDGYVSIYPDFYNVHSDNEAYIKEA